MNKRRLLKLADLLEADAENKEGIKFDLSGWGGSLSHDNPVSVSCGTTACAMGLAVLSGAFADAGLVNVCASWRGRQVVTQIIPKVGNEMGFNAARVLFRITENAAYWLFSSNHYHHSQRTGAAGERAVAHRIRDFVAGEARPS